jgi:hypothetical protein
MIVEKTLLILLFLVSADPQPQDAKAPPGPSMKSVEAQVWDGYYTSAVHVRYHQQCARCWQWWDIAFRVVAIALGVFAFAAPFIMGARKRLWKFAGSLVGLVALTAAVVLNVLCFSDWYQKSAIAADRWSELQLEWDLLRNQRGKIAADQLLARFEALRTKQLSVEKSEPPGPDIALLRRCQAEENHFLGIDVPATGGQQRRNSSRDDNLRR